MSQDPVSVDELRHVIDSAKPATRWTSGKPFVATDEHCKMAWNCRKPGADFRCCFCGHSFVVGDIVRWQFTNDVKGAVGNPFVCQACDGGRDANIAEILKRRAELKTGKWWWFVRGIGNG